MTYKGFTTNISYSVEATSLLNDFKYYFEKQIEFLK